MIVRKSIGQPETAKKNKVNEILWIKLDVGGRKLYVAVVYWVPRGSAWEEQNEEIIRNLEEDIIYFKVL